jgi:hypothetical protein
MNFLQMISLFLLLAFSLFILNPTSAAPSQTFRVIATVDDPDILDSHSLLERNLLLLDQQTPRSFKLKISSWADGAWRLENGILAGRYADPEFAIEKSFRNRQSYIRNHSVDQILRLSRGSQRERKIEQLSPAEKYDLLVGDASGTLAKAQWAEGDRFQRAGTLARWMGICEGSAAAGVLYPEPKKAVTVTSAQGDKIKFHILDLKGLSSLLWSSYNLNLPILGSRCPTKKPRTNSQGWVESEACFNSNPGSFHIVLLNYLGRRRQPFFLNRWVGEQVWNVPIVSYRIHYKNLETGELQLELSKALQPVTEFRREPWRPFRAPFTTHLLGVEVDLEYATGTTTQRSETAASKISKISYSYQLEIDAGGNILGGEWNEPANHPDFLWAIPNEHLRPFSNGDQQLQNPNWDGGVVPYEWLEAIRSSSRKNQPLEAIVRKLVELSQ